VDAAVTEGLTRQMLNEIITVAVAFNLGRFFVLTSSPFFSWPNINCRDLI
jgi:hypothetical protein